MKRRLSRILTTTAATASSAIPSSVKPYLGISPPTSSAPAEPRTANQKGKYWGLSDDQCAICAEDASFDISNLSQTFSDPTAAALATSSMLYGPASQRQTQVPPIDEGAAEPEEASASVPPTFPITTPYCTSCGHVYCYFCLSQRMIRAATDEDARADGQEGWECLRCTSIVKSCSRVEEKGYAEEMGSQDGLSDDEGGSGPESGRLGSSEELMHSHQ